MLRVDEYTAKYCRRPSLCSSVCVRVDCVASLWK